MINGITELLHYLVGVGRGLVAGLAVAALAPVSVGHGPLSPTGGGTSALWRERGLLQPFVALRPVIKQKISDWPPNRGSTDNTANTIRNRRVLDMFLQFE